MNAATPRPPLPRWIWIAGIGILAAVIIVGAVLWAQRPLEPEVGPNPAATAEPTTPPGPDTNVVTGCLAEGQSIDMLLTTQENAPQTEAGAVEFATAQLRWLTRWPWPSYEEFERATATAQLESEQIARADYDALVAGSNASGGIVPEGTPFHLTSVVGSWYVDSYDDETAQVTVGLAFVIGEAVSPLYKSVLTYNLAWTGEKWVQTGTEKKYTADEAFELGEPYARGC